ncbi:MAG: hypothetical protein PHE54_00720 [Bacilli bacterium]|nr:hypothetical protein [Bacilli bacterium]
MRTKNAFYNLITGLLPQLIIGVLGFVKIKIFISTLGVELNGLMQLFAQIFAYLSLAEGGIGSALQFRLYKLLAKKDYNNINKLLSGAKKVFSKIGYAIILVAVIISFKLDIFIKDNPFDLLYIQVAFIMYLISATISYFYVADRVLLSSDQKLYKINIIFNTSQIIKFILEITLLLLGTNIFVLIAIYIILNYISCFILRRLVKKEYPWYITKNIEPNYEFKKDIRHLLPKKIMTTVTKNTDVIVISSFLGIVPTAIYGVYNYIVTFLSQTIDQISFALFSVVGNYNITESKDKIKNLFKQYNIFCMLLANLICVPLLFSFNSFIVLLAGKEMVVDNITMFFFVMILYIYIIMIPTNTFVTVNGLFKETKVSSIIEILLNLALSIILVNFLGIKGVLLGTVISSLLSNFLYAPYVLYKKVFQEKGNEYYLTLFLNIIITFILVLVLNQVSGLLTMTLTSFLNWFIFGIVIFIINLSICLLLYFIFYKEELKFIIEKINMKKLLKRE